MSLKSQEERFGCHWLIDSVRLATITKRVNVNGEEMGAKDKAEGGGISKGLKKEQP